MKSKKQNMIVTGGAGFIGSHLVKELQQNYNLTIIDNFLTGNKKNLNEISKRNHTIKKQDLSTIKTISQANYDSVFHLASLSDVRESMEDPLLYFKHNVVSTVNLLELMRKNDISKLVFASSSTVYGESKKTVTEKSATNPISIYGITKLICEQYIKFYCNVYGIKAVSLRLANIIGENSSKGLIHDLIKKFRNNPHEISILGNGKQKKSYLHVSDCVNAMVKCHNNLRYQKTNFEIYNVSNRTSVTVNEITNWVAEAFGIQKFATTFSNLRDGAGWIGDVKSIQMSIAKLSKIGWHPVFDCEQAVKKTIKENF